MSTYHLISVNSQKLVDEKRSNTRDPETNGPLEVIYDYTKIASRLNRYMFENTAISSRKYLELYPIRDFQNIISLGEGATPLYKSIRLGSDLGITQLYFKYEGVNPTGSFKDRGTMVEITKAIELGYQGVAVASTGNMAASVSAYATRAGLDCFVFVPSTTPKSKLAQTMSYGANIIQCPTSFGHISKLTEEIAKKRNLYIAGDYCFRQEGQKSQAYEIIEQMGMNVPDYVIVPVGVGTNIAGIWKGFKEFQLLGFTNKLPKMIAVQAKGASPIIKSVKLNLSDCQKARTADTISSAICVDDPLDGIKVIQLIKESGGFAVDVTDQATLECQHDLACKESIFAEPASATTIAALHYLQKNNLIEKDKSYVCLLSGAGLKDSTSALHILEEPPTVAPSLEQIDNLLSTPGFINKDYSVQSRDVVIFSEPPTFDELAHSLKSHFKVDASIIDTRIIIEKINQSLLNAKSLTKVDLQYILEQSLPKDKKALDLLSYLVTTKHNAPPSAEIKVHLRDIIQEAHATGEGPVDAVINAITTACQKDDKLSITITHFLATVSSEGPHTEVNVDIQLQDQRGHRMFGYGTSKNIVKASLDAFVNSYNTLALANLSSIKETTQ